MSEKKKILIFIDWFIPGYKAGGPIRSVANMIDAYHKKFDFLIITSDRDLGELQPYENIEQNKVIQKESYSIIYLSPENQTKRKYYEILNTYNFDFVYFNSLFSYKFTLLPLRIYKKLSNKKNVIIAPRGMLGKGALNLKRTKKRIFLFFVKSIGLFRGIIWHATTEDEKIDICSVFGKKTKIKVAGNLPTINNTYKEKKKTKELTKFYFLSRVSKKKNLHYAINILNKCKFENMVVFDIYGPIEDESYWRQCETLINNQNNNLTINYKGTLNTFSDKNPLLEYHFFLFPTLHENFGHVIFESLSYGIPVITSNNTPWINLESKGVGWDIDLKNTQNFIDVINKCTEFDQKEYDSFSKKAFDLAVLYAKSEFEKSDTEKLFVF